jgi:hypothetical protein
MEAAIGIEPMNKGFAVLAKLFAQDRLSVHRCIFINLLAILVCRRSPEFAHVAIGSDPRVTQESSPKIIERTVNRTHLN